MDSNNFNNHSNNGGVKRSLFHMNSNNTQSSTELTKSSSTSLTSTTLTSSLRSTTTTATPLSLAVRQSAPTPAPTPMNTKTPKVRIMNDNTAMPSMATDAAPLETIATAASSSSSSSSSKQSPMPSTPSTTTPSSHSRKRQFAPSFSVEFNSRESTNNHGRHSHSHSHAPTTNITTNITTSSTTRSAKTKDAIMYDESDTDVASHTDDDDDDDESYNFDCEDDDRNGDDNNGNANTLKDYYSNNTNINSNNTKNNSNNTTNNNKHKKQTTRTTTTITTTFSCENTPETNNSTFSSVSRVGAKVRRLDLSSGGNHKSYAAGSGSSAGGTMMEEEGKGEGGTAATATAAKPFSNGRKLGVLVATGPMGSLKMMMAQSRHAANDTGGGGGGMEPLMESPTCPKSPTVKFGGLNSHPSRCPPLFESPPSSPPPPPSRSIGGGGHGQRKTPGTYTCPPSTAKKGRTSRIFHLQENDDDDDDDNNENNFPVRFNSRKAMSSSFGQTDMFGMGRKSEEDDVSPRDASGFPFFGEDFSPSKENGIEQQQQRTNNDNNNAINNSSNNANNSEMCTTPHSPECPATLKKKKKASARRMDLGATASPPKGLKQFGRANSFLQIFSQESNSTGAFNIDNYKGDYDEDDFISRPNGSDNGDNGNNNEQSMEDDNFPLKSPKRTMRNFRRGAPSSPADLSPAQGSSSFSRFAADFEIVGTLGNGSFGKVYKVRNRMDRRMYAIKAAKREARGTSDRDQMLQEVFALAALSDETSTEAMHIVRYHQAWMEGNRLYIQFELCQSTLMEEMGQGVMEEKRRYKLLREMLLALDLVHKSGMIHLDIKPENIFIKNDQYKLGDFGLVSKIENHDDVEEGDSRYMSMELLSGDLDDLTKSDIFSLGATMYEVCLGRSLPENGQEWQDMRKGMLLPMPNTAFELQMIIREMMAPDKESRPSAAELLTRRQLLSDDQRQLIVERNKANAANMALDAQMKRFELLSPKRIRYHRSNTIS